MKLLIIDNNDSFTFNLVQMVEETGLCSIEVKSEKHLDPKIAEHFDKILLSPGPGVPSDYKNMTCLLQQWHSRKSFLGICLGHQAIAEFFSAVLCNLSSPRHGKTQLISIMKPDDPLFRGLPQTIEAGLYHSWAVDINKLPAGLTATAIDNQGTLMGISHDTFDVKGLQFHPESVMTAFGPQIIHNWLSSPIDSLV